jgi:hypothetical protein
MFWIVLQSLENFEHDRCVDLFRRDDATFGFESFRRDHEAKGGWFPVGGFADDVFSDLGSALQSAQRRVPWFDDLLAIER